MRAARYYGKEDIRIEQVEVEKCGQGQIRVGLLTQHSLAAASIFSPRHLILFVRMDRNTER